MKKLLIAALLTAGLSGSAFAAVSSDLILGFRDTSNPASNLEIDLGQVSVFAAQASGTTVTYTNLLGLGSSSINQVYGAGWNTSDTLLWGVAGSTGNTTSTRTLYATSVATGSLLDGTADSSAWIAKSAVSQSTAAAKISTLYSGLPSTVGVLATSATNSWSGTEGTTPAAFSTWSKVQFENTTDVGSGYLASDLYELAPANANNPGNFLGTFAIFGNGNVTFTAAGALASIPEPTTYAAILGMAVLGFVMLRRKQAIV